MTLALIAVYVVGYIVMLPHAIAYLADDLTTGGDDRMGYVFVGMLALIACAFWPLLLAGCAVGNLARPPKEKSS